MTKVYPWWQPAADIAKSKGVDDQMLETMEKSQWQKYKGKDIVGGIGGFADLDEFGRDPKQLAAETAVSELIQRAIQEGDLPAYDSTGRLLNSAEVQTTGLSYKGVCVEPKSVNRQLKDAGFLDAWQPLDLGDGISTAACKSQPVRRPQARQNEILKKLREFGLDPKHLPKRSRGSDWMKRKVRDAVGHNGIWVGSTVFDKAWDKLRADGEIAEES